MFSPFSCASFTHQQEDDDEPMIASQAGSSPRKSSRSKGKDSKNPYSNRGLDKFSALVADLEEKRQQIYAQTGSQDITFVRFVFKDAIDTSVPVPIVVKLKDKKEDKTKTSTSTNHQEVVTHNSEALDNIDQSSTAPKEAKKSKVESDKPSKNRAQSYWNINEWRRPSYYLPVVMIFILVLLAFFGRSFAILCTCVCWYAIPMFKGGSNNTRRGSKKKEYVRRLSDKKMVITEGVSSPKSNNTMPVQSQQYRHQKSFGQ